jgi:photosystem II stability/assembly factor-like uncharacterized protein
MRRFVNALVLALVVTLNRAPAQTAGGPPGGAIEAIAIDPKDPNIVYAATDWSGVFKSTDGGQNWTASNLGPTKMAVFSLSIDPLNVGTLYAGTASGVFKTVDGGRVWTNSSSGLRNTAGVPIILTLAIDPVHPQTLYGGTLDRIFKSTDGAKTLDGCCFPPERNSNVDLRGTRYRPTQPRCRLRSSRG